MKFRLIYHTAAIACVTLWAGGCAHSTPQAAIAKDQLTTTQPVRRVAIVVGGVFGDGPWYDGLIAAGQAAGDSTGTVEWGRSKPLFFENFKDRETHAQAEAKLADAIDALPRDAQVDLIAHSAGCGVVLGALPRTHRQVATVVLLAPSVSPGYRLDAALEHVDHKAYSFYSTRDTTFLRWRTSNFGTYDDVNTTAAGYAGFTQQHPKLQQIQYDAAWEPLGNDGGHNGWLAQPWLVEHVTPLLRSR